MLSMLYLDLLDLWEVADSSGYGSFSRLRFPRKWDEVFRGATLGFPYLYADAIYSLI